MNGTKSVDSYVLCGISILLRAAQIAINIALSKRELILYCNI